MRTNGLIHGGVPEMGVRWALALGIILVLSLLTRLSGEATDVHRISAT